MTTKEQFELFYAEQSGITVAELHALGRRPQRCECDYVDCEGWQMISRESAESEIELGRLPESVLADYPLT